MTLLIIRFRYYHTKMHNFDGPTTFTEQSLFKLNKPFSFKNADAFKYLLVVCKMYTIQSSMVSFFKFLPFINLDIFYGLKRGAS